MGEVQNFRKGYDWMFPVLIPSGERSTAMTKCRKEPKTHTNRGHLQNRHLNLNFYETVWNVASPFKFN